MARQLSWCARRWFFTTSSRRDGLTSPARRILVSPSWFAAIRKSLQASSRRARTRQRLPFGEDAGANPMTFLRPSPLACIACRAATATFTRRAYPLPIALHSNWGEGTVSGMAMDTVHCLVPQGAMEGISTPAVPRGNFTAHCGVLCAPLDCFPAQCHGPARDRGGIAARHETA